jgi:hypothetical protein
VHRYATRGERQSDPARPDPQFERAPASRDLDEDVDDRVDDSAPEISATESSYVAATRSSK